MSPRKKKAFQCGHKGLGQFCHACAAQEQERQARREDKLSWESEFSQDPIDLRAFPKHIAIKTREVLAKLMIGDSWGSLGGKLLQYDRAVVSIPVTRDYRLICLFVSSTLTPLRLESHEDYNVKKPGT